LFAVVDQFFFFISCISFWLFALWPSQYTLDDYKKKKKSLSETAKYMEIDAASISSKR